MTLSSTPTLSIRMVFSNRLYIILAIAIAGVFWVIFNIFDGLLFFSPLVTFYYPLPDDSIAGFVLSSMTAGLVGIVVAMNLYIFRNHEAKFGTSFFSGSTHGTVSSIVGLLLHAESIDLNNFRQEVIAILTESKNESESRT